MKRHALCLAVASLLLSTLPACGDSAPADVPFTIQIHPQFVNGVIPGAATVILVTIANESPSEAPVSITATADGAAVAVEPGQVAAGEVAEVTVVAEPTDQELPIQIAIHGSRGEIEASATRDTTIMTWEDDRGDYARTLLDLFTAWLAENRPELGITPDTEFSGSLVAPGLLVVSHYCFMSDDWELGLGWHVMIPPDDWAEIHLRPRDAAAPTIAFRLSSQAAALEGGAVEVNEVPPPPEVIR